MSNVKVTRSGIEEANKHLQALYMRVQQLEKLVNDQHEAIMQKDEFMHSKITELSLSKDAEINSLTDQLEAQEKKITLLESELKEMDKLRDVQKCKEKLCESLQDEVDKTKLLFETQRHEHEIALVSLREQLRGKDEEIDYLKNLERITTSVAEHIPDLRSLVYSLEKANDILKRPVVQNGPIHVSDESQIEKNIIVTGDKLETDADPLSENSEQFFNSQSSTPINHDSSEKDTVDLENLQANGSLSSNIANCIGEKNIDKQRGKEFYL